MGQRDTSVSWISWGPIATVATFAALSAMWVALTPAGEQTELAGRTWEQFALQDPEVAYLVSRQHNVLGFLGGGFGLLAAVVSVLPCGAASVGPGTPCGFFRSRSAPLPPAS